jgi:hypothetical protein
MNLHIISSQYFGEPLGHRQSKPCREKVLKHDALIFSGLRCGFSPRQTTDPGLKTTLQSQCVQIGLGH